MEYIQLIVSASLPLNDIKYFRLVLNECIDNLKFDFTLKSSLFNVEVEIVQKKFHFWIQPQRHWVKKTRGHLRKLSHKGEEEKLLPHPSDKQTSRKHAIFFLVP